VERTKTRRKSVKHSSHKAMDRQKQYHECPIENPYAPITETQALVGSFDWWEEKRGRNDPRYTRPKARPAWEPGPDQSAKPRCPPCQHNYPSVVCNPACSHTK
jgi:hypothetical protein